MNDIASRGKVSYITLWFCCNVFYLLEVHILSYYAAWFVV
jgi:hypothetical protein